MAKTVQTEQNFSFRRQDNGRVIVCNSASYTMAIYDENTGLTRWQRVVPAGQREKVQEWLLAHYPIIVAPVVAPRKNRSASAAA